MLYDLARGVLIHGVVAREYVRPGATYLVLGSRGAEGGALAEMVRTWVGGKEDVQEGWDRWLEQARRAAGASEAGCLTPTSSAGTATSAGTLRSGRAASMW